MRPRTPHESLYHCDQPVTLDKFCRGGKLTYFRGTMHTVFTMQRVSRAMFKREFNGEAFAIAEELCKSTAVDVVRVATPGAEGGRPLRRRQCRR